MERRRVVSAGREELAVPGALEHLLRSVELVEPGALAELVAPAASEHRLRLEAPEVPAAWVEQEAPERYLPPQCLRRAWRAA